MDIMHNEQHIPLTKERQNELESFCKSVSIHMDNLNLLDQALTHTSYAHENHSIPRSYNNERLEFLGDSVLSTVVSTYMFQRFTFDEGRMTKLRAQVVCETSLYQCAERIGLGEYLHLGHGEIATGGRRRPSILADAFEAVLGSYYLDQGYFAARDYVLRLLQTEINQVCNGRVMMGDYKSMLQEMAQHGVGSPVISYEIIGWDGPEHNRIFKAGVNMDDVRMGTGEGRTKKEAEQAAAHVAVTKLKAEKGK